MAIIEEQHAASSERGGPTANPAADVAHTQADINGSADRKALQSKISAAAIGASQAAPQTSAAPLNGNKQQNPGFKQPFLTELNKEVYPEKAPEEIGIFHPHQLPRRNTPSTQLPPQESDIYRTTFTLVDSKEQSPHYQLSSFTLKGKTETEIDLLEPTTTERVLHLPQIAQQALNLAEKLHHVAPKSATFDTARGELTFTRGEQEFVVSPEYVLVRKSDREQRALLESQVADMTKQLSDKLAAIFEDSTREWTMQDGLDQLKSFRTTLNALSRRVDSELETLGELADNFLHDLEPGVKQYDILSADLRSEIDSWKAGLQRQRMQENAVRRLLHLSDSLDNAKASLVSLEVFDGHLSDGRAVTGIRNVQNNNEHLVLYGTEGAAVARFTPLQEISNTPGPAWSRHLYQQDGSSLEERFKQAEYPRPYARLHLNSAGEITTEESLHANGVTISRNHILLGTRERFKEDGSFESLEIVQPALMLQNIDAVAAQKGGHDAILRMITTRGDAWAADYQKYRHRPDAQEILETAISAMPLDKVQQHRLNLENSLSALLKQAPTEAISTAAKEAQVFLDLFRFRERMLEDGLLIARKSHATNETPALASQVWNDPRSRHYFSVDSNWIDWDSERVQRLMGGQDTPLARADLKLLVSRALYAGNLEPTEQTTKGCILAIDDLRNQYSGISIIKGRNIVFGAHSATLSSVGYDKETSSFLEASGDHHQFGKRALIDRIQKQHGEDRTFTLLRPERDSIGDAAKRAAIMTANGLSSEQITTVEEQLQSLATSSKIPENTLFLYQALMSSSVEHGTAKKIISELNGDAHSIIDQCRRTKAAMLEQIAQTPPPFTFIFEGHGGPDAIYLSDGELVEGLAPSESRSTTKITADELAAALREREARFGIPKAGEHDIIVFQNCYSSNFVQRLGNALEGGRLPVCIGAAEHNLVSLYLLDLDVGSLFMGEVVTPPDDPDSTIGDILSRQYKDLDESSYRHLDGSKSEVNTNPIIYAPDQSGVLQQIGFIPQKRHGTTA